MSEAGFQQTKNDIHKLCLKLGLFISSIKSRTVSNEIEMRVVKLAMEQVNELAKRNLK